MSNKCRNCDATAPDWSGNGLCIVCARDEVSKDQERAEQELDTIFRKDWILERYQNEIPEWSDGSLQLRIVYYDGNTETYPYTASYDLVKADLLAWHQRKLDEAVTQAYLEFCNKYLGYRAAKQAIYSALKAELFGNTQVYDITDAPAEFCAGYNTMAEATRVMLLGQRAALDKMFGREGEQ